MTIAPCDAAWINFDCHGNGKIEMHEGIRLLAETSRFT